MQTKVKSSLSAVLHSQLSLSHLLLKHIRLRLKISAFRLYFLTTLSKNEALHETRFPKSLSTVRVNISLLKPSSFLFFLFISSEVKYMSIKRHRTGRLMLEMFSNGS